MFWDFLQQLEIVSKRKGQKIALITDNARYHHAKIHQLWRQQHAPMFTLNYFQPYGPLAHNALVRQPDPLQMPDSKLERAYLKVDKAIDEVVELLAA